MHAARATVTPPACLPPCRTSSASLRRAQGRRGTRTTSSGATPSAPSCRSWSSPRCPTSCCRWVLCCGGEEEGGAPLARLLSPPISHLPPQVLFWTLGEYGYLAAADALPLPRLCDKLCALAQRAGLDISTRGYAIAAILKLSAQVRRRMGRKGRRQRRAAATLFVSLPCAAGRRGCGHPARRPRAPRDLCCVAQRRPCAGASLPAPAPPSAAVTRP